MTRVLVFSTLFPNAAQPNHGVFVENRLRETLALGGLEATVVAPVPWFPSRRAVFGRYARFAAAPRRELRHDVEVRHPRYLVIPKLGAGLSPGALFRAGLAEALRLQREGRRFDVIDAHYFHPDGVAAARLGRALRLPVVITARGSDLTQIAEAPGPRARIRWAAGEASALVGVCEDLRQRLVSLGAPAERTLTLRNGVDLTLFAPADRTAARAAFGARGFTLVSVGALIPRKDHALTLAALAELTDCTLLIAGDGPLRGELEALARRLGVVDRVRFLGETPHAALPMLYSAADAMVLASSREGWANVLLEAMACGTPVVASDVNGTAEVVRAPAAGRLMPERTPAGLVAALSDLRRTPPAREDTRRYAEQFGWRQVGRANKALLEAAAAAGYEHRHAPEIAEAARACLAEAGGTSGQAIRSTLWTSLALDAVKA
jgi:glycosyltransferase involved in cell wall biosynthesis